MYKIILTLAKNEKLCERAKVRLFMYAQYTNMLLFLYCVYNSPIRVKCFNHLRRSRGAWLNAHTNEAVVKLLSFTWRLEMFECIPFGNSLGYISNDKKKKKNLQRNKTLTTSTCTRTHNKHTNQSLSTS